MSSYVELKGGQPRPISASTQDSLKLTRPRLAHEKAENLGQGEVPGPSPMPAEGVRNHTPQWPASPKAVARMVPPNIQIDTNPQELETVNQENDYENDNDNQNENNLESPKETPESEIIEGSCRYTHHVSCSERARNDESISEKDVGHLGDPNDGCQLFNGNIDLSSINDTPEQSAILSELEKKVRFGPLGSEGGSLATYAGFGGGTTVLSDTVQSVPTVTSPLPGDTRGRSASLLRSRATRKNSLDSNEYMGFEEHSEMHHTGAQKYWHTIRQIIHYMTPNFNQRVNIYFLILFLLVIAMVARKFKTPRRLLILYLATISLEFACSLADRLLSKVIDIVFEAHFDIAYQLHSLNGPFGMVLAVLLMRTYWDFFDASELIKGWDNYIVAAAIFLICLCAKNWLGRRQYIYLLEHRFTEKVENLNNNIIVLSELASTRPPKGIKERAKRRASNLAPAPPAGNDKGVFSNKVRNVFEDLAQPLGDDESDDGVTKHELYQKRRSFWQSAARLSATAGVMKVITYNGVVTLHSQDQAKQFGKKLYRHLSKGGKLVVTPELIKRLFEERREAISNDAFEKRQHDAEMAHIVTAQASTVLSKSDGHEAEKEALWAIAVEMLDPYNLGRISEDFCVEAVNEVYKEQRFTAASITDFGELHQSLRLGIDIVYWLVMLFVLQAIFGFDITTYLLPFITLLLTLSFAIAPLVGNVFLAFAFVFFMSPYEIGNRVQFGHHNPYQAPIIGYIKSVGLLYTIVTTLRNETVKIPNHTLYGREIYNMTETSGAVHEFTFYFNIFGEGTAETEKLQLFFQRLKHYTLRESKEWKSFLLAVGVVNNVEDSMEYKVYAVHREGWGFYKAVNAAKVEYYAAVKRLREELGLTFARNPMPVAVHMSESDATLRRESFASTDDGNTYTSGSGIGLRGRSNASAGTFQSPPGMNKTINNTSNNSMNNNTTINTTSVGSSTTTALSPRSTRPFSGGIAIPQLPNYFKKDT